MGGSMFTSILMVVSILALGVAFVMFNSWWKLFKMRKNAKGKIFCIFRKPSGEYDFEFCIVKGKAVYRGVENYGDVKDIGGATDPRLGREVYFLKNNEPTFYTDVRKASSNGHEPELVAAGAKGKKSKGATEIYAGPRGRLMSKREFQEAKESDPSLEGTMASSGRGHALFPVLSSGLFSPQISVPVAYFVEGFTLETDPLDVALEEFGADPQYNSFMTGSILDEKLTKLWAWWSNRFDDLLQKLSKQMNPTIMYIIMGLLALGILVLIGLVYTMRGDIAALKEAMGIIKGGG